MTLVAKETNLLLTGFAIVFFAGFLLANSILMCTSFIPLFIYFMGVFFTYPKVQINKSDLPSSVRLGEILELKIAGKITGSPCAVVICDDVPKPFHLVEGSNYKVVAKGFKDKVFSFSYKMRCTKCGHYGLGTGWKTRHILGLTQIQISIDGTKQLKVLPPLPKIKRIKLPVSTTSRIHARESIAKIGPLSTDFKEIRDYFYGDSFKTINWKASAKAASWGKLYPLVNEYEREGKRSIWIFLDANPDLRIGTSIEDALECGIRVAYSISHYFLNKGYSLGMYVYNHRGERLHFDAGKKQFFKIAGILLKLIPAKVGIQVAWDEGFSKAVEMNRNHLATRSPVIAIITHVTPSNWHDLLNGFRRILAYERRRRRPNIVVINVLPYTMIPTTDTCETFAAKMLDATSRSYSDRLRNLGLTIIDWDPRKESIENTLLNTLRLK